MGLAMFLPGIAIDHAANTLLAGLGSYLVMASIFAVNDWADIHLDTENPLKRKDTFLERGVDPKYMLGLAVMLAAGGLAHFAALSALHAITALFVILFGLAYSVPVRGVRGKSVPVVSSLLHFGGTLLAFMLGALTFAPFDWRALLVASHPGVLISAGHLVHEVEDYEQDRLFRCRTNAVRFGQKTVFVIASLLFGLSFLLLVWLADEGFLPHFIKYTPILYLVYGALAIQAYRAGLTRDSVRRLRTQYRLLFAVVVLAMLIGSLLNKGAF